MGNVIPGGKKKREDRLGLEDDEIKYIKDQGYEEDTIDSSNLALAIKRGDFTSNVQLRFSCENLPKMNTFSLSDPIIAVYQTIDGKEDLVGLTEYIPCNCNPKFIKPFIFSYNSSSQQQNPITVKIYDVENFDKFHQLKSQSYIGQFTFTLHDVMLLSTKTLSKEIWDKNNNPNKKLGTIQIRGQEYDVSGKKVVFELGVRDIQSKHEIYIAVSCMGDGRECYPIYATQPERNLKKSVINWKKFSIPLSSFGENDKEYIKLEVFEYHKEKVHVLIGEIETTVQHLIEASGTSKKITMNSLVVGEIKLHNVYLYHRNTFLHYLLSDAEVSLITAVDFTNSNGPLHDKNSLHYMGKKKKDSDYANALRNLIDILQYFDSDNRIPFYGFGAKLEPYQNIVSHSFAINGNYFNPNINGGQENLVNQYKQKLHNFKLHGPTVFSEVIEIGKTWAEKEENRKNYYVLLIITDGVNNDKENTIDQIVQSSYYPLTIIFVGIGNEDLTQIKEMLTPKKPYKYLYSKKYEKEALRDNVHFFYYSEYSKNIETLSKECLRKIPRQFIEYMEINQIEVSNQEKNMKEATEAYMNKKIDQNKNAKKRKKKTMIKFQQTDKWLEESKHDFIKQLKHLGYQDVYIDEIIKKGIAAKDINLFIEMLREIKENEKIEKQKAKQLPESSKIKINTRLDIPESTLKATKIKKDPKIGQKIFKVKQVNQLDLQIEKQKTQNANKQQQFIQAIQIKQPDDIVEIEQKKKKQQFLEKKFERYLKKSAQKQQNHILSPMNESSKLNIEKVNFQQKKTSLLNNNNINNISNNSPISLGEKQIIFKGDFDASSDEDSNKNQEFQIISRSAQKQKQEQDTKQKQKKLQYLDNSIMQNGDINDQMNYLSNLKEKSDDNNQNSNISISSQEDEENEKEKNHQNNQNQQNISIKERIKQNKLKSTQKQFEEINNYENTKNLIFNNDLKQYQNKNSRCYVCNNNEVNVLLQPCGHSGFCQECFAKDQTNNCPICQISYIKNQCILIISNQNYDDIYN